MDDAYSEQQQHGADDAAYLSGFLTGQAARMFGVGASHPQWDEFTREVAEKTNDLLHTLVRRAFIAGRDEAESEPERIGTASQQPGEVDRG